MGVFMKTETKLSLTAAFITVAGLIYFYGQVVIYLLMVICPIALIGWMIAIDRARYLQMTPEQQNVYRENSKNTLLYGSKNSAIVCQQCQTKGNVYTRRIVKKSGVSGGKATAALLTGGISLFAVGLSKKVPSTDAFCTNCKTKWSF